MPVLGLTSLEGLPVALASFTVDGSCEYANSACAQALGVEPQSLVGRSVAELFASPSLGPLRLAWPQALAGQRAHCRFETTPAQWFEAHLLPEQGLNASPQRILLTAHESSVQADLEDRLAIANLRWESLVVHNPDTVLLARKDTSILYINRVTPPFTMEQVLNSRGIDFIAPDHRARVLKCYAQAWDDGLIVEFEAPVIFGPARRWHYCRLAPLKNQGATECLLVMVRDTTERHEMDQSLQERDRLIRSLTDNLPDAMLYQLLRTPDGKLAFQYVSAGVVKLSGLTPEQLMENPQALLDLMIAEDRRRFLHANEESLRQWTHCELQVRKQVHGELRWSQFHSAPRRLQDGSVVWDGVELDITSAKRAEEERGAIQAQLQQAMQMESLGMMAAGIAHDFNNHLLSIQANAQLALRDAADAASQECLQVIEQKCARAAELCKQMLAYAGKIRIHLTPTDVNAVLSAGKGLFASVVPRAAELTFNLAPSLPLVQADALQLQHVVNSLIANAGEALVDGKGLVEVSTGVRLLDEAYLCTHRLDAAQANKHYLYIQVRDTGVGMTPALQARIFEPFFSTKFTGRGLGLAAVQGIIRSHGGFITVQSTPSVGSCFTICLPTVD